MLKLMKSVKWLLVISALSVCALARCQTVLVAKIVAYAVTSTPTGTAYYSVFPGGLGSTDSSSGSGGGHPPYATAMDLQPGTTVHPALQQ